MNIKSYGEETVKSYIESYNLNRFGSYIDTHGITTVSSC